MSNHSIGYAMSKVSGEVCKLLDSGELSFSRARRLIDLMQDVVGDEDGNNYEMWDRLENRCCVCLQKKNSGELLEVYGEYADGDPRFWLADVVLKMNETCAARGPYCCIDCVKKYMEGHSPNVRPLSSTEKRLHP